MKNDYKYCAHCGSVIYSENDVYCRSCGSNVKDTTFAVPDLHNFACIYGPPMEVTHRCPKCGETWVIETLGGRHEKYCPKCGSIVDCEIKDDSF